MKNLIINKSKELFFRYGYSKVRVDEIAEELGISKKTVYNHFKGKEDLLLEVIIHSSDDFDYQIKIIDEDKSLIFEDKVHKILSVMGRYMTSIAILVADLKRNYIEGYNKFIEIKKEIAIQQGVKLVNEGIELGLIERGMKSKLALYLFLSVTEKLILNSFRETMPEELISDFPDNNEAMMHAVIDIIYSGIKTKK